MRKRVLLSLGGVVLVGLLGLVVAWRIWGQEDVRADGPLVVRDSDWLDLERFEFQALAVVELDFDGECVTDTPVLWPDGTTWLSDEEGVRLPDGRVAHDGDRVTGGGGSFYGDDPAFEDTELARLLAPCREPGEDVFVFNLHEELDLEH